ncbi:MAG: hypothetical protein E7Y34_03005 [Mycoplasma sp.]|nr:hypothetical protein [Mycoplasma sp.]
MDKGISFVSLTIPKSVYQFQAALWGGGTSRRAMNWKLISQHYPHLQGRCFYFIRLIIPY